MSANKDEQQFNINPRDATETVSGVVTPEYKEPVLSSEEAEKKALMQEHAQRMLELISQPTISERAQHILQNMPQDVQQKLNEFGVVYNKDGTERTPKDVEKQRDEIKQMLAEGPGIKLIPTPLPGGELQTQENIDSEAAKVIQGTQYPDGLGPKNQLSYDLPKIYAFEIENKVRVLIETLIEPLAFLNKESHEKMVDFKRYVDYLTQSQNEIKAQFEDTVKLKQLIKDFQLINKQLFKDANIREDALRAKLSDHSQLLSVHEDKLIKVAEDKKIFEAARTQMRNDIRDFELLSKDLVFQTNANMIDIKDDFRKQFDKCTDKIDSLRFEVQEMRIVHRHQKNAFRDIQGKIGWTEEVLKEMQKVTEDLPPLFNQVRATDKYLNRYLPLQIQNQIYHSQKGLVLDTPKIHLTLLENTKKAVDHLVALSEDEHMPFDKENKEIPNLKAEIFTLTERVQKMENSDSDEDDSDSDSDSDDSDSDDSSDGSEQSGVSEGEMSGYQSIDLGQSRPSSEKPRDISKVMSSNSMVKLVDTDPDEPAQISEQPLPDGSIQARTITGTISQPSSIKKPKKNTEKTKKKPKKDKESIGKPPNSTKHSDKKKKGKTDELPSDAVDQLALRIASRLLKDDPFVNALADILDGVPPPDAYYDSEEERAQKEKERKAMKKQKKKDKKSGKKSQKSSVQASTIEEPESARESEKESKDKSHLEDNLNQKIEEVQPKKPAKAMSGIARRKAAAKTGMNSTIHEQNEEEDEQGPDKAIPSYKKPTFRDRSPMPPTAEVAAAQRMNATPSPGPNSAPSSGLGRRRASNEEAAATFASLKQDGDFTKLKVARLEAQVKSLLKKVSGLKSQVVSLTGESDEAEMSSHDDYGEEHVVAQSQLDGKSEARLGGNGPASLEAPASSSRGGGGPRLDAKGYVTTSKFMSAQKQILDLRKKVGEILQKMHEEERSPRFAELIKTELQALSLNVEEIRHIQRCVTRAEDQVELLKLECKKELKRLQRQNFQVTADFEQQQRRMENLHLNVSEVEKRVQLSDTTMATIFKMLRIQYALLHQDEVDKQDIYLMGLKDAGGSHAQHNPQTSSLIQPTSAEQAFDAGTASLDTTQSPHDASIISQNTADPGTSRQKPGHRDMKHWLSHGPPGSKGHQILSIDKSCLHQMGQQQIPALYKGFKMACLSYAPSQVSFENKIFDRNALVEAQGYLLYLALQHMRHLDFSQIEKSLLGVTMQDEARAQGEELLSADANYRQIPESTPGPVSTVLGGEGIAFDELKQDSLTMGLSQGGNAESRDLLPAYGLLQGEQTPSQNDRGTVFLSSRAAATLIANPSTRMISLSKSKEYARLAANVPGVYSVEAGKKVLQESEVQMAGVIGVGQQTQDKYARNIHHLKLYQKQLQSQRGTSQGKTSNVAAKRADDGTNHQGLAEGTNLDSLNSRHSRKKSVLYAQSLRKNNQTTAPEDSSLQQFSLNSARQKRSIFAGDALKHQAGLALNQRGAGYFENPLTPKSPQNVQIGLSSQAGYVPSEMKVAKTPKRLAKISGITSLGKTEVRTPRNDGGMSNLSSNPHPFSNALSSRPIQHNRFPAGLGTGQSLAIVPTVPNDRLGDKLHSNPNVLSQHQLPSISMTRQSLQLPHEHLGAYISSPANANPAAPKILINEKVPANAPSAHITPDLKIDTQYEKGQGFQSINKVIRLPNEGQQFTDLVKTELNNSRDVSRDNSL